MSGERAVVVRDQEKGRPLKPEWPDRETVRAWPVWMGEIGVTSTCWQCAVFLPGWAGWLIQAVGTGKAVPWVRGGSAECLPYHLH